MPDGFIPYTPLEMYKSEVIVFGDFSDTPGWWVEYRNYRGERREVCVPEGADELGTYVNALKVLNKYKHRADKRKEKKEQAK